MNNCAKHKHRYHTKPYQVSKPSRHNDAANTESNEHSENDAARIHITFHVGVNVCGPNLEPRLRIVHIREAARTNQGLVGDPFGYTDAHGAAGTSGDTAHGDASSSTGTGAPRTSRRHWRTNCPASKPAAPNASRNTICCGRESRCSGGICNCHRTYPKKKAYPAIAPRDAIQTNGKERRSGAATMTRKYSTANIDRPSLLTISNVVIRRMSQAVTTYFKTEGSQRRIKQ